MEETKKRRRHVVLNHKEIEALERLISALYGEVVMARDMLQSVIDASDNDPFKEARMYIAESEFDKAVAHSDILVRFADSKFYKGS